MQIKQKVVKDIPIRRQSSQLTLKKLYEVVDLKRVSRRPAYSLKAGGSKSRSKSNLCNRTICGHPDRQNRPRPSTLREPFPEVVETKRAPSKHEFSLKVGVSKSFSGRSGSQNKTLLASNKITSDPPEQQNRPPPLTLQESFPEKGYSVADSSHSIPKDSSPFQPQLKITKRKHIPREIRAIRSFNDEGLASILSRQKRLRRSNNIYGLRKRPIPSNYSGLFQDNNSDIYKLHQSCRIKKKKGWKKRWRWEPLECKQPIQSNNSRLSTVEKSDALEPHQSSLINKNKDCEKMKLNKSEPADFANEGSARSGSRSQQPPRGPLQSEDIASSDKRQKGSLVPQEETKEDENHYENVTEVLQILDRDDDCDSVGLFSFSSITTTTAEEQKKHVSASVEPEQIADLNNRYENQTRSFPSSISTVIPVTDEEAENCATSTATISTESEQIINPENHDEKQIGSLVSSITILTSTSKERNYYTSWIEPNHIPFQRNISWGRPDALSLPSPQASLPGSKASNLTVVSLDLIPLAYEQIYNGVHQESIIDASRPRQHKRKYCNEHLQSSNLDRRIKTTWDERYKELVTGDCNVPRRYPPNQQLGILAMKQRLQLANLHGEKSIINTERQSQLEAIDFSWCLKKQNSRPKLPRVEDLTTKNQNSGITTTKETSENNGARKQNWMRFYEELVLYKKEKGDCLVPKSYSHNPRLAAWVSRQRIAYNKRNYSHLDACQISKLEAIDFSWVSKRPHLSSIRWEISWEERYKELIRFRNEFGHCSVPQAYPPNPKLGKWVMKQRTYYQDKIRGKKSSLTDARQIMLEATGFSWSIRLPRMEKELSSEPVSICEKLVTPTRDSSTDQHKDIEEMASPNAQLPIVRTRLAPLEHKIEANQINAIEQPRRKQKEVAAHAIMQSKLFENAHDKQQQTEAAKNYDLSSKTASVVEDGMLESGEVLPSTPVVFTHPIHHRHPFFRSMTRNCIKKFPLQLNEQLFSLEKLLENSLLEIGTIPRYEFGIRIKDNVKKKDGNSSLSGSLYWDNEILRNNSELYERLIGSLGASVNLAFKDVPWYKQMQTLCKNLNHQTGEPRTIGNMPISGIRRISFSSYPQLTEEEDTTNYVGPAFILSTFPNKDKDFHIVSTTNDGHGLTLHFPQQCMIHGGSWNSDPPMFRFKTDVPSVWVLYLDNRVFSSNYKMK